LMRTAFRKLESGTFNEALQDVDETLKLFASLKDYSRQKEAAICATYKLALKLLIARGTEINSEKIAFITAFLADLQLQPKHRMICLRMAIKASIDTMNYGVAARFLDIILPLNLVDKSSLEIQMAACKEKNLLNSIEDFPCLNCNNSCSSGCGKCPKCGIQILLCFQTLALINSVNYCWCDYCHANLSLQFGGTDKCTFCYSEVSSVKDKKLAV